MLHVDIPTRPEIRSLAQDRGPVRVSLYLATTPLSQEAADKDRIGLKNLAAEAARQLEEAGCDARQIAAFAEQLDDLVDDEDCGSTPGRSTARCATCSPAARRPSCSPRRRRSTRSSARSTRTRTWRSRRSTRIRIA